MAVSTKDFYDAFQVESHDTIKEWCLRKHRELQCAKSFIIELVPLFQWISEYNVQWFKKDMISGVTVAILLVPQSLAYAQLAGLPPEWGLYASILPLVVYVMFSTSTQVSIGPVATTAIMVASVVEQVLKDYDETGGENANPPTESDEYQEKYAQIAMMVSLNTGMIRLLFGIFRAALIILIEQIKALLGEDVGRYQLFYQTLMAEISSTRSIHPLTVTISCISLFILFLPKLRCIGCIRRIPKWMMIPLPLLVVAVNILCSVFFEFASRGVVVVGNDIKTGFLPPSIPSFKYFTDTFFGAFIVAMVSYMGSMALAVQFDTTVKNQYKARVHRYYEALESTDDERVQNASNALSQDFAESLLGHRDSNGTVLSKPMPIPLLQLDANSEFIAYGLSNIVGSFFGAMVVSASYSRSALNFEMNAVTPFSQIVQAVICTLCLLVAMPALSPLPKCVLSAVVTVSVNRLIRNGIEEWRFLWAVSRVELFEFSVALIAPLVMGLEVGIFVAIAASVFVNFILRNSSVLVAIHRLLAVDGGFVDERIVHRMDGMNGTNQQRVDSMKDGQRVEASLLIKDNGNGDGDGGKDGNGWNEILKDGPSTGSNLQPKDYGINVKPQNAGNAMSDSIYVMELNAQLSYINVRTLMDELRDRITSSKHKEIRYIIVSLALTAFVDTTTLRDLTALFQDLKSNEKYLGFSNCKLAVFRSIKMFENKTKCCFADNHIKLFLTTSDAVSYFQHHSF